MDDMKREMYIRAKKRIASGSHEAWFSNGGLKRRQRLLDFLITHR